MKRTFDQLCRFRSVGHGYLDAVSLAEAATFEAEEHENIVAFMRSIVREDGEPLETALARHLN